MAARATSQKLRELFERRYRDTHDHVDRLSSLFRDREERPRPSTCQAMRGIIEEARDRYALFTNGDVLDAALLGSARRIEHYEIAAYTCACTYAAMLNDQDAVRVLQQTLDEDNDALSDVTALAEHSIGQASGDIVDRRDNPAMAKTPPTSLMPGVWSTETSGFAAVPPRADSDLPFTRVVPSVDEERRRAAGTRRDHDPIVAGSDATKRADTSERDRSTKKGE